MMNKTSLLRSLQAKLGPYQSREKDFDFKCLKCRDYKKRLTVSLLKGVFNCFHCGWKGTLRELKTALKIFDNGEAPVLSRATEAEDRTDHYDVRGITIPGHIPIQFPPKSFIERKVVAYFVERGVSQFRMETIGLGVSSDIRYRNRAIIPIRENGLIRSFTARSVYPNVEPKELCPDSALSNRAHYLYNFDYFPKAGKKLVLVEGLFDCEALYRVGFTAMAVMGCHLSEIQVGKIMSKVPKEIKIMFDGDPAGKTGALVAYKQIVNRGYYGRVSIVECPEGRDPADLAEIEIRGYLS